MKLRGAERSKYKPHQGRQECFRRACGGFALSHRVGMAKRQMVAQLPPTKK